MFTSKSRAERAREQVVDTASTVSEQLRERVAPKVGAAARDAKDWAAPRVERGLEVAAPRVEQAVDKMSPKVDAARDKHHALRCAQLARRCLRGADRSRIQTPAMSARGSVPASRGAGSA